MDTLGGYDYKTTSFPNDPSISIHHQTRRRFKPAQPFVKNVRRVRALCAQAGRPLRQGSRPARRARGADLPALSQGPKEVCAQLDADRDGRATVLLQPGAGERVEAL